MRKTLYIISLLIFSTLFLIPLIIVLINANTRDFIEVIKSPYFRKVIGFTFKQAFLSMIFSLIIGLPGSWIMAKYDFKFKNLINVIYYIPFVLPSILVVLGFVIFYGNSGILSKILKTDINILYSFKAVLLAHAFFNFPVVINIVSNGIRSLDNSIEEAASLEEKSQFIIFKEVTLPRLLPSIIASAIIVFLFCFSSFAIILVLGGGPKLTTIEVEIYKLSRISLDTDKASTLALISMCFALITVFLYSLISNKTSKEEGSLKTIRLKGFLPFAYLVITSLFILLPIVSIFIRGIGYYRFVDFESILNTLTIGLLSSGFSVITALLICSYLKDKESKLVELIVLSPMAVSSIILGLGYYMVLRYFSWVNNYLMIVLCHGVLNIPFAVKSILPNYRNMPISITESAKIDGCRELDQIFKIETKYLRNTILSTFMLIFALSCGELNSTLMISTGTVVTIPVQIQRMIGAYNFNGACAMGSTLIIICLVVFYLFNLIP